MIDLPSVVVCLCKFNWFKPQALLGGHQGTRVTPEDKRRAVAQRAAEVAERRAVFDANNNN